VRSRLWTQVRFCRHVGVLSQMTARTECEEYATLRLKVKTGLTRSAHGRQAAVVSSTKSANRPARNGSLCTVVTSLQTDILLPTSTLFLVREVTVVELVDDFTRRFHNFNGTGRVRVAAQRYLVVTDWQLQLLAIYRCDCRILDLTLHVLLRLLWVPCPVPR
jgi:hypothetical protein